MDILILFNILILPSTVRGMLRGNNILYFLTNMATNKAIIIKANADIILIVLGLFFRPDRNSLCSNAVNNKSNKI